MILNIFTSGKSQQSEISLKTLWNVTILVLLVGCYGGREKSMGVRPYAFAKVDLRPTRVNRDEVLELYIRRLKMGYVCKKLCMDHYTLLH